MISRTNTQRFVEEGKNCASTILVEHLEPLFHTLQFDMNLFGSDMILFGSSFKFQELSVMLVAHVTVDVIVTFRMYSLVFLITRCLFRDVFVMYLSHVMPRGSYQGFL